MAGGRLQNAAGQAVLSEMSLDLTVMRILNIFDLDDPGRSKTEKNACKGV